MMSIRRSSPWLAVAVLALMLVGDASAGAFEAHNPIEPPFGSFAGLTSLAVDLSDGNVYAIDSKRDEVKVFGSEGGGPAGGAPSSFTGAGSPTKTFEFGGRNTGVAVDNACSSRALSGSECSSYDSSNGDVYFFAQGDSVVDKYRLNGSEYEYVCEFKGYGGSGNMCLANGGAPSETFFEGRSVAVDSAGNVYVAASSEIFEFNSAGEGLRAFGLPAGNEQPGYLAVSSSGTIYIQIYVHAMEAPAVLELKRSSLTGAVEGEPTVVPHTAGATGVAFDQASGQLFVDLGSSGEALDGAHTVVSRFGSGVIMRGGALTVDEATGDVYVANGVEENIDRFGPAVVARLPIVDELPPSVSDVTRTSVLLSGKVNTEDATTAFQLEYTAADEYQPAAANPYAGGGITPPLKLAPAAIAEGVGPLPLIGLLAGTTYHYRLVATNEVGTTYGQDHTFATAAATPPVATTSAAIEVTQTAATLSGTVATRELQTSYVFEVGTDTSHGGTRLFGSAGSGGTEAVSVSLQFLIPGVTYHFRLSASNADGTSYGQDMTFTTPGVSAPILQPQTTLLIPSPTVQFPSLAGAISKPRAKPPTRAKKLASALKACAKKPHSKRAGCQRQAHKKYGATRKGG